MPVPGRKKCQVGKIGQTPPIMACKKKNTQSLQQSNYAVAIFNGQSIQWMQERYWYVVLCGNI